ncbi:Tn3 family transposase [Streptomyces sp. NPDC002701]|uniref:Tn3 family transposase n=1 Tax=Streptomyces sp. NPDC002701 TaxID=3364661 RepID=UPI0036C6B709
MAFGLYKTLGFRFASRFCHLANQWFWRANLVESEESTAGCGPLEAVACSKVNLKKMATHWPDLLRVAGLLITTKSGPVTCYGCSAAEGHPAPPCGGRSPGTGGSIRPCTCWSWSTRSTTPTGSWPCRSLATARPRDLPRWPAPDPSCVRDGQEDQLAAFGLVLNAVVRWTAHHLDAAVAVLCAEGQKSGRRTSLVSPRSVTGTSTSWAATCSTSRPAALAGVCALPDRDAVEEDEG